MTASAADVEAKYACKSDKIPALDVISATLSTTELALQDSTEFLTGRPLRYVFWVNFFWQKNKYSRIFGDKNTTLKI